MFPRGVRLEQHKKASLKNKIEDLPVPDSLPEPEAFAPPQKGPRSGRILSAARQAGIVDELDGTVLSRKLESLAVRGTDILAACCFDEDPYTTSSEAFVRENAGDVAAGLELAAKACGAKKRVMAAGSRAEARRLQTVCEDADTVAAGRRYPAQTLLTHRMCRPGRKAAWVGAQACAALAAAVQHGKIQSKTVVTVAGDGIRRWANYRVRIGMPVNAVLGAGLPEEDIRLVVIGSSVSGRIVLDLSLPVTAATRCVIALKKTPPKQVFPCIGCGNCARACPAGIIPWLAYRELEGGNPDPLRLFHVENCIGCDACGIVCPSGIDLVAAVRRAAALKEGGVPDEIA